MRKAKALSMASTLFLAVTMLSGCGSASNGNEDSSQTGASPSEQASAPAKTDAGEKVTLSVVHYMVEKPKVDTFKKLTDKFTELNPNVSFDISVMPVDKYNDNIKLKVSAGDTPDIIFGRPAGMVDMTKAGAFLDVTNEAFVKRVDPAYIPNVTYEGKVYGLPIDLMTNAVIYNKDLFKEAGVEVPKTYSELLKAAETLKSKGITPFAASWKDGASYMSFMWPDMWGTLLVNNPDYASKIIAGEKSFSDVPGYKDFLQRVNQLSAYANSDAKDIDYDRSLQYFAQGKAAMDIMGSFAIGSIRSYNPSGNFGVFMYPATDNPEDNYMTYSTDDTWMIGAKSANIETAKKFFDFMASDEGAQIWADGVQTISTISKDIKPAQQDPISAEFQAVFQSGKIVNNQVKPLWYGQYDDTWQKVMTFFLVTDPAERNVDETIKKLDDGFAKINKMN
ncbi:raffinose/stachyose/melibiose transport system substrate-binding protein [Paenibacillus algorifonticola]|uniref:Raffinose/stachyose/melibiose transport system substrate-binding protein n=1 Tax=Paenibacillus algorifonticola TaxID=684063 RepID=A0A1I2ADY8_9BACL|nr:extracellular solute-binding protein [Paenibacillus algorifonticola]SFE41203.1 raffinose/stachyose/melibiose transport system substrate-binding protein [Paenibacillus algorifonticola]